MRPRPAREPQHALTMQAGRAAVRCKRNPLPCATEVCLPRTFAGQPPGYTNLHYLRSVIEREDANTHNLRPEVAAHVDNASPWRVIQNRVRWS
jgi:hypothetical protein